MQVPKGGENQILSKTEENFWNTKTRIEEQCGRRLAKAIERREEVRKSRVEQRHTQVFGFTARNWKGTLRKETTTMTEKKTEKGALFSRGLVGACIGTLTPF